MAAYTAAPGEPSQARGEEAIVKQERQKSSYEDFPLWELDDRSIWEAFLKQAEANLKQAGANLKQAEANRAISNSNRGTLLIATLQAQPRF